MSKVKKLIIVQYKGEWNQDAGYEVEVDEFGTKNYEKIYILKYAQGFHWTNPGKKAYSLKNHGNGFIFKDHTTGKKFELDYCQTEAIRLLLDLGDEKLNYLYGSLKKTKNVHRKTVK